MNLALLNPLDNDMPEVIEEYFDDVSATCCAFNRRGTLLAVGCSDGRVVVWDFDTRSMARTLHGHAHPVMSVCWAKNGRKVLSSSSDFTLRVWDILGMIEEANIRFDCAVLFAQFDPRNVSRCIATPIVETPVLVNLTTGTKDPVPLVRDDSDDAPSKLLSKSEPSVVACFSKRGEWIFTGNPRGIVAVVNADTMKIERTVCVPGGAPVKSISFDRKGKWMLVNSADRSIRCFDTDSFQQANAGCKDVINNLQWKKCAFSGDGDYIIAGSAQKAEHNIYIWSRAFAQLNKILEGPKEGVMDVVWHPTRPIIVSISCTGLIYIWTKNYTENWSAFAPDFTELEENEEYQEREDEFDIKDEDESRPKREAQDAEANIDITTIDKISAFSSESEGDLSFLPTIPDPDVPPPPPIHDISPANAMNGVIAPASQPLPKRPSKRKERKSNKKGKAKKARQRASDDSDDFEGQ